MIWFFWYYGRRYRRSGPMGPVEAIIFILIAFAYSSCNAKDYNNSRAQRTTPSPDVSAAQPYDMGSRRDAAPIRHVGEEYKFGRYKQVSDLVDEPIVWRILEVKDKRLLICSEMGLDRVLYNFTQPFDRKWESSSIRKWLNNDFAKTAFYEYERERIVETVVENKGAKPTRDKIFLLSSDEFNKYFGGRSPSEPSRYSVQRGTKEAVSGRGKGNCWVWLRDSGVTPGCFAFVEPTGEVNLDGKKGYEDDGSVRPAMWVEME